MLGSDFVRKVFCGIGIFIFIFIGINATAVGDGLDFLDIAESADQNQKVVYLTFDDGPSIYTRAIMEILNEHSVPGIFFILGESIDNIPESYDILNELHGAGHFLALHTMTHNRRSLYRLERSPQNFVDEMFELQRLIAEITGHHTNLCRAPYGVGGNFKAAHWKAVTSAGLYCVDWHIDSRDWEKSTAQQVYDEVSRGLKKKQDSNELVILFHENARTITALPQIIEMLQNEGYTFRPYAENHRFEGLR